MSTRPRPRPRQPPLPPAPPPPPPPPPPPGTTHALPHALRCSSCAAALSDATALFTSCGHLFCAAPGCCARPPLRPDCTVTCPHCATHSDVISIRQRAARYSPRVRHVLFDDAAQLAHRLQRVLRFRDNHVAILAAHVDRLRREAVARTAECARLTRCNAHLVERNARLEAALRAERVDGVAPQTVPLSENTRPYVAQRRRGRAAASPPRSVPRCMPRVVSPSTQRLASRLAPRSLPPWVVSHAVTRSPSRSLPRSLSRSRPRAAPRPRVPSRPSLGKRRRREGRQWDARERAATRPRLRL
eukprot:gb/GEZJ01000418.1/.p1 GENE.gb/GEZJ01000418.1/~~gb/GEZJ01000418.1/.p1  ORF type:complete len:301 (+),score=36.33 gb/GEZJ01000418.1/:2977-3879(+)